LHLNPWQTLCVDTDNICINPNEVVYVAKQAQSLILSPIVPHPCFQCCWSVHS